MQNLKEIIIYSFIFLPDLPKRRMVLQVILVLTKFLKNVLGVIPGMFGRPNAAQFEHEMLLF